MAISSAMLPLGTPMPDFELPDAVTGQGVAGQALTGRSGVLVLFICNHCPYVLHLRAQLIAVAHQALDDGFSVAAINSNSVQTHPQDGPGPMKDLAASSGWRFPFLFDATQDVARAFKAACTPDLFLFDAERRLAYRGQFDDSRPKNDLPVTGKDLREALATVAAGRAPPADQKAGIGCGIKWHPT